MCGISGIVDFESPIDRKKIERSLEKMHYRGPDNSGIYENTNVTLGHARLSIIDLNPRANQPFFLPEKNGVIVLNGEIYNYHELRKILLKKGYTFKTTSDTEVLLTGYFEWGYNILDRLVGMFAFAIYDLNNSTLFFARDRFGEKPFLFCHNENSFSFASNLAGLCELIKNRDLNTDAINELIAYQYISSNHSIYKGINKLNPGHYGVYNKNGLRIEQYWFLNYSDKIDISVDEAATRVDELLNQAIEDQLNADVPVGVFLSGGNDSGIVAAIASNYKSNLISVTMTVPGSPKYDESKNARAIADIYGLNSNFVILDNNCTDELPALLAMTEPFADSSILPAYNVAHKAKKFATVVLTGDGGDEIFGGYGKPSMANRAGRSQNLLIANMLDFFGNRRFNPLFNFLGSYALSDSAFKYGGMEFFLKMQDFSTNYIQKYVFQREFIKKIEVKQAESLIKVYNTNRNCYSDFHDALLYLGVKSRLPDDFLLKIDTATMAASLESRAPFLDHRLIEFTSKLKPEILMPGRVEKGLLKRVAEKYLPKEIIYSQKKGFSIPVDDYFRKDWGTKLLKLLDKGISVEMGIINPKGVKRLLEWHRRNEIPQLDRLLFSILVLELWLEINLLKKE